MTRNEFILQAMLHMASDRENLHKNCYSVEQTTKDIAYCAKLLADAAEKHATFDKE